MLSLFINKYLTLILILSNIISIVISYKLEETHEKVYLKFCVQNFYNILNLYQLFIKCNFFQLNPIKMKLNKFKVTYLL